MTKVVSKPKAINKRPKQTQIATIEPQPIELNAAPPQQIKVLSLFSGCGGMDLGFEGGFSVHKDSVNEAVSTNFIQENLDNDYVKLTSTRFKTIFANDILDDAKEAHINYFSKRQSKVNFHLKSIVDLVKSHRSGEKIFPDEVDLVTGGFPCQDFSVSGKRKGFNSLKDHNGKLIINHETASVETRGQLYMWMKEVIEITQPKMFIAENVKGLVNLGDVKEIIQNDFSAINGNGYLVLDPVVLHAADYGVPQSRERVIFIGIKKSSLNRRVLNSFIKGKIPMNLNPYPPITHSQTPIGNLKPWVKLSTIFQNLPEPEKSKDLSHRHYSKAKFMGKHCQGQTEVKLNSIAPTIRAEHHGNIEFRRLGAKNGGIYKEELVNGMKERRLSVRECALIQTFPPDYEFVIKSDGKSRKKYNVSSSQAYKIIGNAVPPLLAYNLAKRLDSIWNELFF
jgi:DNA (cytosine-5)-methyltransferase 1